ncbi:MAG: response regulator transcription factor [Rhodoluna sp.]|jgi:DNA-binding NarL/FixJ family response regulator|nr:response regulator transcription factor [Rhodoluna sp.]
MNPTNEPITIAIVDDHDSVRLGVKAGAQEAGYLVVEHADSVQALLGKLKEPPRVVVLDLSLADGSTPATNVKKLIQFGSKVLIYSIADNKDKVNEALREGAEGVVSKSQDMTTLFEAIRLSANGITINTTETVAAIDNDISFRANLSERELQVVRLYASGMTLKSVAYELKLSKYTVKEHIDRARDKYSKVGRPVTGKSELLIRLIEDGLFGEDLI